MAQRIDKIYRLVTVPRVYRWLQLGLGADNARNRYLQDVVQPRPGMRFLDIGCGPASILPYLPELEYTGLDLNPSHIAFARETYGSRGTFLVADAARPLDIGKAGFDIVNISALLHHLSDDAARQLIAGSCELVRPGGRIVTFDNVWLDRQNPIAKLLIGLDSGLNVRTPDGYLALSRGLPVRVETRIYRNLLRVPYDHFCMILTRSDHASTDGREERHVGSV